MQSARPTTHLVQHVLVPRVVPHDVRGLGGLQATTTNNPLQGRSQPPVSRTTPVDLASAHIPPMHCALSPPQSHTLCYPTVSGLMTVEYMSEAHLAILARMVGLMVPVTAFSKKHDCAWAIIKLMICTSTPTQCSRACLPTPS